MWYLGVTSHGLALDMNDDGGDVNALLKRLLIYDVPTDEQLEAENLPIPPNTRFSHAEDVLFRYMLDTYTKRLRFCKDGSTQSQNNWTQFHERFNRNRRVLVIRSRTGDKMPLGRAELFDRSVDTLSQKRKDMRRKKNM